MNAPHFLIVGGGTAAISAAHAALDRGATVTLFHDGLPLGGCCLNVGCVPSKFLIRAAEAAQHARHARFPGVTPQGVVLDVPQLLEAQRNKVTELRRRNYEEPLPRREGLRLVPARATLQDARTVAAGGEVYQGDFVLIATGSRTSIPGIPGADTVPILTNETLFHLETFPESVLVLGGGYIALEMAQMLCRLGSRVTLIQRSGHLLSKQPTELGETLAELFRSEGMEVLCGTQLTRLSTGGAGIVAEGLQDGSPFRREAAAVFSALGRQGNTEGLGLEALGIVLHGSGYIRVNARYETAVPGIYAAGDVLGGHQLVYTASAEAERAVAACFGDEVAPIEPEEVPWVVFTDPQIAGIGMDLEAAGAAGHRAEEAVLPVNRWPRFSTLGESRGFLQLIRDADSDILLGARALCPEGGDLMTELAWIRRLRIPLREVANSLAPYLTLSEGIAKCAARFPKS